jgi:hypothetical protein
VVAGLMQSPIEHMLLRNKNLIHVILNEVKDQLEVRDVSVKRYCRRVILHFVQDDM